MFVCLSVFGAFAIVCFGCLFVCNSVFYWTFVASVCLLQFLVLRLFVCCVYLFICSGSTVAHTHIFILALLPTYIITFLLELLLHLAFSYFVLFCCGGCVSCVSCIDTLPSGDTQWLL